MQRNIFHTFLRNQVTFGQCSCLFIESSVSLLSSFCIWRKYDFIEKKLNVWTRVIINNLQRVSYKGCLNPREPGGSSPAVIYNSSPLLTFLLSFGIFVLICGSVIHLPSILLIILLDNMMMLRYAWLCTKRWLNYISYLQSSHG